MHCPAGSCRALALVFLLSASICVQAQADDPVGRVGIELSDDPQAATVTNNDFEAGTLTGWTIFNSTTSGTWRAYSGTTTPQSGSTTYAPPQGTFAAVADMFAQGNYVLYQDIALPAGQRHTLSFILFYSNRYDVNTGNGFVDPAPTATNLTGTQHYRVDLIKTTAAPDTMVASDILTNIFQTRAGDPESLQPTLVTFDISAFAGQTVRLRFAAGVHLYYFYSGVDDVRITSNLIITGRVANAAGRAVPHTTVSLSDGTQTRAAFTDAAGRYLFDNVTSGANYTVTPSKNGYTFVPPSQAFTNVTSSQTADFVAASPASLNQPAAGNVIISRFRTRGTRSSQDEFIELYNNTDTDIVVNDTSAATLPGWALVGGDSPSTARVIIPNGALIPARGHYLVAQTNSISTGYNLINYAGHDTGHASDFVDGRGIALFRSSLAANFTAANRLDSVGFVTTETNALFFEGTGLQPSGGITTNTEHVFMRKMEAAVPQDTGDNASDFVLVTTAGAVVNGVQPRLGSTGPENFSTPAQRNAGLPLITLDCGTSAATAPNRITDSTANGINTKTLKIRRTVTNNTGAPVTQVRFRVVHVTTLGTPNEMNGATQADVRAVTSANETVAVATPCVGTGTSRTVQALMLDAPTTLPSGGGLNSSLRAGTITLQQPLQPGQSVDVNFWLAVVTSGQFRYFLNVEAQP